MSQRVKLLELAHPKRRVTRSSGVPLTTTSLARATRATRLTRRASGRPQTPAVVVGAKTAKRARHYVNAAWNTHAPAGTAGLKTTPEYEKFDSCQRECFGYMSFGV